MKSAEFKSLEFKIELTETGRASWSHLGGHWDVVL